MATKKKTEAKSEKATPATVGRQELSRRVAQKTKLSQKQVGEVLEATLVSVREVLQEGDEVRLVGFGSLQGTHECGTQRRQSTESSAH